MDHTSSAPITQLTQAELNSALLTAAENGQSEQVTTLIAQGADLHARDQWGQTALMLATYRGHADVVTDLVSSPHFNSVTLHATSLLDDTALMLAARNGHTAVVTALISSAHFNATTLNAANSWGDTALKFAAENRHSETAFRFLSAMPALGVVALQGQPTIGPFATQCIQAVNKIRNHIFQVLWAFQTRTGTELPQECAELIVSTFCPYSEWYRHRANSDINLMKDKVNEKLKERKKLTVLSSTTIYSLAPQPNNPLLFCLPTSSSSPTSSSALLENTEEKRDQGPSKKPRRK